MSSEVRYTRTPFSLLPHRQVVHIGMGKRVFIEWGHHNPEDPGCLPCTSGNAPPPPPRRRIHLALLSQHGTARVVGLLAVGFVAGWPAGDTAAAWRPGPPSKIKNATRPGPHCAAGVGLRVASGSGGGRSVITPPLIRPVPRDGEAPRAHGAFTEGHTPSPPSARLPSVGAQKQPDGTEGGARRGQHPYE